MLYNGVSITYAGEELASRSNRRTRSCYWVCGELGRLDRYPVSLITMAGLTKNRTNSLLSDCSGCRDWRRADHPEVIQRIEVAHHDVWAQSAARQGTDAGDGKPRL